MELIFRNTQENYQSSIVVDDSCKSEYSLNIGTRNISTSEGEISGYNLQLVRNVRKGVVLEESEKSLFKNFIQSVEDKVFNEVEYSGMLYELHKPVKVNYSFNASKFNIPNHEIEYNETILITG